MAIKYLALLRRINVGGKNIIKMADLKNIFAEMNFTDVRTYIQSGNVVFTSAEKDKMKLKKIIERTLSKKFKTELRIAIFSAAEYKKILENSPRNFSAEKNKYVYDVWFLLPPLTPAEVMNALKLKDGVDRAWPGVYNIFTTRLTAMFSKSHLAKIMLLPMYQNITIRNWNTTQKLAEMLAE